MQPQKSPQVSGINRQKSQEVKEFKDSKNNIYYVSKTCLGKGTFGTVFEGELLQNSNQETIPIAAKCVAYRDLINQFKDKEQFIIDSLGREATLGTKIKHKNIIKMFHVAQTKSNIYFFLEKCDGNFDDHFLKKTSPLKSNNFLQFSQIDSLFNQMIKVMYALHKLKVPICHRDIKPENFLIQKQNNNQTLEDSIKYATITLKLGDFGSAKQVKKADKAFTYMRGTMQFMSPELLTGEFEEGDNQVILDIQMKHDSWALGQILFRMIYNVYPFPCEASESEFLSAILDYEDAKNPEALFPKNLREIPQEYAKYKNILIDMLQYKRENRLSVIQICEKYFN